MILAGNVNKTRTQRFRRKKMENWNEKSVQQKRKISISKWIFLLNESTGECMQKSLCDCVRKKETERKNFNNCYR